MAGIYIHIPFCKQACHYCDFHFSTSTKLYDDLIAALIEEIISRKNELNDPVLTIYFGGGTPSVLKVDDLVRIISCVKDNYTCDSDLELTFECNPDDVSLDALNAWRDAGINRLSLGIQSFDDDVLKWMNRAHNASMGTQAFKLARQAGFDNISCDLIYGIPDKDEDYWTDQLSAMMSLKPEHLSCYCLTVESKTVLDHQLKKGLFSLPSQENTGDQFLRMRQVLKQNNYTQYEVSNFCLPGKLSKHNSSYWKNALYLGFGPSAHSFNGSVRRWNVSHNVKYVNSIKNKTRFYDQEALSLHEQYNEYVMTGLRTVWGVDLEKIGTFGNEILIHFNQEIAAYADYFETNNNSIISLNEAGLLIADKIASDLFIVV
jgi:oxygen-independent coproporphyrinogen-3 oxidase